MTPETTRSADKAAPASVASFIRKLVCLHSSDEPVSGREFRVLIWLEAVILVAALIGHAFLYTAVTDLGLAMEVQFNELRDDLRSGMRWNRP